MEIKLQCAGYFKYNTSQRFQGNTIFPLIKGDTPLVTNLTTTVSIN